MPPYSKIVFDLVKDPKALQDLSVFLSQVPFGVFVESFSPKKLEPDLLSLIEGRLSSREGLVRASAGWFFDQ